MKMFAIVAALAIAAAGPAVAAPVSQSFNFIGSPVTSDGTSFALSGRISVTFNEGESAFVPLSDYTFDQAVNVPSLFLFVDYEEGELVVGSEDADMFAIRFLSIDDFLAGDASARAILFYRPLGGDEFFVDPDPTIVFDDGGMPVPEPATVALLGLGVLGVAAARRRHPARC